MNTDERTAHLRAKLERAVGSDLIREIDYRPHYARTVEGFVIAVGAEWVLISVVTNGYFDGWYALRIDDVVRVKKDKSFVSRFARTLPEWPPTPPGTIDLDSVTGVLSTMAASSPLVAIQRENHQEGMWIGVIAALDEKRVRLKEVRPDATWRTRTRTYSLRSITNVSVRHNYLVALTETAGSPPPTSEA